MLRTGTQYRQLPARRPSGLDQRRARARCHHASGIPADRLAACQALRHGARGDAQRGDVAMWMTPAENVQPGAEAAEDAAGLAGQAGLCRCAVERDWRRRRADRRRDDRRVVVAVGRQGGAGRRSIRGSPECRAPHHACADGRSVPCVGEHRSEGRPLQAAAGAGPGHAAPRGEGTDAGIVVRGAKYETAAAYANQAFVKPTDRELGRRQARPITRSGSSSTWGGRASSHLPHRFRRPRAGRGLSAVRTASTKSTR